MTALRRRRTPAADPHQIEEGASAPSSPPMNTTRTGDEYDPEPETPSIIGQVPQALAMHCACEAPHRRPSLLQHPPKSPQQHEVRVSEHAIPPTKSVESDGPHTRRKASINPPKHARAVLGGGRHGAQPEGMNAKDLPHLDQRQEVTEEDAGGPCRRGAQDPAVGDQDEVERHVGDDSDRGVQQVPRAPAGHQEDDVDRPDGGREQHRRTEDDQNPLCLLITRAEDRQEGRCHDDHREVERPGERDEPPGRRGVHRPRRFLVSPRQ